jgi:Copper chaperone
MHSFIVEDLVCEACSAGLANAIRYVDPDAKVEIDLASQRVTIESELGRHELEMRLIEAGYNAK